MLYVMRTCGNTMEGKMEPRLYIVMREDLWDMNPGKGMAQAAHAQANFDEYTEDHYTDDLFRNAHLAWSEDRAFGTTLVLSVPSDQWPNIQVNVEHYGVVHDLTYPYRNWYGQTFVMHTHTCMWVFAITDAEIEHMKQWKLHQ